MRISEDDVALSRQERVLGLVTVYRAAEQHFAYFEQLPDLDWDKEFMAFLPLVEGEQTLYEYYRTLQRFAALLQDGHTRVQFPASLENRLDRLPVALDVVEDQWVVIDRYPTPEVRKEDVPRGSVVLSIDGIGPSEYFERNFFPFVSAGRPEAKRASLALHAMYPENSEVQFTLRYPNGTTANRVLIANRKAITWTDELREQYGSPPEFASKRLEDDVLYVRYGSCNDHCQDEFLKLIESLNENLPAAVILDLRGNPGGGTPTRTVASLISQPIPWYQCSTRWSASYIEAQLQWWSPSAESGDRGLSEHLASRYGLPDRFSHGWYAVVDKDGLMEPLETHYDGPVVILTDHHTESAAEDLVVLLHGAGRAVVVGEPTFGSTGQPINFDLPGGGWALVCTVRARYADGREFIDVGCKPDVPVRRTIRGIAEGQDEMLDAALEHIRRTFPSPAHSP